MRPSEEIMNEFQIVTDPTNVVFLEKVKGRCTSRLNGLKSERPGYYFPSAGMNRFSLHDVKIPQGFLEMNWDDDPERMPRDEYISRYICDSNKHHVMSYVKPEHLEAKLSSSPVVGENEQIYAIHDNGGRPFIVYVSKTLVSVYRIPENEFLWPEEEELPFEATLGFYHEPVYQVENPKDIFIGQDSTDPRFNGNSILVHIKDNKYLFIGQEVYTFSCPELITEFYSRVGNSDTPYPVWYTANMAYYALDKVGVPLSALAATKNNNSGKYGGYSRADGYNQFYDQKQLKQIPMHDLVIIQKRI